MRQKKPRITWKTAIVQDIIPSKDVQTRRVNLRFEQNGRAIVIHRPVSKLYPLEASDDENRA